MNLNRRGLLVAGAGAALSGSWSCARASDAPEGSLQRILDETGAPALIGAVVATTGISHLEAAGLRRKDGPDRVTTNDLWHLGSNTKAMTAAHYGLLVEQGKARWGATVPDLFPDLTVDPAWKNTTVEQLMGHRAGVEERSIMMSGWLMKAHQDPRPIREQRADVARMIFEKAPAGEPGKFAYANFNYVIVGAAIERIRNATWEDAVQQDLFRPLGMTSAGFGAPKGAQPWGHRPLLPGVPAAFPVVGLNAIDPATPADNPAVLGPAGRAHMTMTDYAKFVRLFLTRGGAVLEPETVAHLTTPVPGEGRPYALGWGVSADRPWARGPQIAHEGSNTMWHAVTMAAPARGVAILTASNAGTETTAASRLAKQLQERFAAA